MKKHLTITLEWYGPYSREDAIIAAKKNFTDGLYLGIGKTKSQKSDKCLQYIGIASDLHDRISKRHYCLDQLTQKQIIYLGLVTSYEPPGKNNKSTKKSLDYAEWAHVYFLDPLLNEKKKFQPPPYPVSVLNKWWKTDFKTPRLKRPTNEMPDLIEFNGTEFGAKLVWFGSKVEKWTPSDF